MKRLETRHQSAGFTVVELLIATVIFSLILLIITSGIIHFTEDYYKGIHQSSTQTVARNVVNVISQNLQFGGGTNVFEQYHVIPAMDPTGKNQAICIGSVQIDYSPGAQLGTDGSYGVFVTTKDPVAGCQPYASGDHGTELLAPNMRLTYLAVQQIPGNTGLYDIKVGVAYGDSDLLCSPAITMPGHPGSCVDSAPPFSSPKDVSDSGTSVVCKDGSSSAFCAYSRLSTVASNRFSSGSL